MLISFFVSKNYNCQLTLCKMNKWVVFGIFKHNFTSWFNRVKFTLNSLSIRHKYLFLPNHVGMSISILPLTYFKVFSGGLFYHANIDRIMSYEKHCWNVFVWFKTLSVLISSLSAGHSCVVKGFRVVLKCLKGVRDHWCHGKV